MVYILNQETTMQQALYPDNTIEAQQPGLGWLLVSAVGGALAAVVVAGVIAGRIGITISGPLLLAAALLGALPRLIALVRGRWALRGPELAATLIALVMAGGIGLELAWPSLLPLGLSVDAVHHYQLVNWIAEHGAFPPLDGAARGLMGEMVAYPPGLALVVIATAALTSRPPIDVLYPTVALLGGLSAALVTLLAVGSAARPSWRALPLALVGLLLLLAHRVYTLEAYTDQSYYAMVLGVVLLLLAGGWLIVEPRLTRAGAAQLGLALAALVGVYPLWVAIPGALALLVLGLAAGRWRHKLLLGVLALGPAAGLALLDLPARLDVGQIVLAHQGLVALPSLPNLIPVLLALPCIPLVCAPFYRRMVAAGDPAVGRGRRLVGLAGLAAGALLALLLWARLGRSASYHGYKLLFVLTPLAAAIVGAGAIRLGTIARLWPRRLALVATVLLLAATGSWRIIPPPAVQVLTPDAVAAARWITLNSPRDAKKTITIGAPAGPLAYWLQVGLLGQRRDTADLAMRAFDSPPPSPEGWIVDEDLPNVAIVPQIDMLPPGATVLARVGSAVVLRRAPEFDVASLDPLLIRYRTTWEDQRLKTQIELLQRQPGRTPLVELRLLQGGTPIASFPLQPDEQRTRTQYLGLDVLPTLGAVGYINRDAFPSFTPPAAAPSGTLSLMLRLTIEGNTLDERLLATFERTAAGQIEQLSTAGGELVYLRREALADRLQSGQARFADTLLLTGWSQPTWLADGESVTVDLRWQALRPIDRSLFAAIEVLDADGQVVADNIALPQQGFYPTWRWRPGENVADWHRIALPPNLAPGVYHLRVSLRDFAAQDGSLVSGAAQLGEFMIE
jgi:hypothetical protein